MKWLFKRYINKFIDALVEVLKDRLTNPSQPPSEPLKPSAHKRSVATNDKQPTTKALKNDPTKVWRGY